MYNHKTSSVMHSLYLVRHCQDCFVSVHVNISALDSQKIDDYGWQSQSNDDLVSIG
jgi:general stress protein 26